MGYFDYICIKKFLTPIGGQHLVEDGTCYVTNKDYKLLLRCVYSGMIWKYTIYLWRIISQKAIIEVKI